MGGDSPGRCKIEVLSLEQWNLRTNGLDASFLVGGHAGSRAITWLVANPTGANPIPGGDVEVGPGPFKAEVTLKLTGVPREFWVMLEVNDPSRAKPVRCKAVAKAPDS
jgi:hypothetical protein